MASYSEKCDKLNNCDSVEGDSCVTSSVTSSVISSVTSSDSLSSEEVQIIKEYRRVWRNIGDISRTIRRNRRHTRSRIISKLLQAGLLEMEYPDKPTHPAQRYRTVYKKEK